MGAETKKAEIATGGPLPGPPDEAPRHLRALGRPPAMRPSRAVSGAPA